MCSHNSAELLQRVRAEVDRLNQLHIGFLEKAGVELMRGWGRFADAHSVSVVDQNGSEQQRLTRRAHPDRRGRPPPSPHHPRRRAGLDQR